MVGGRAGIMGPSRLNVHSMFFITMLYYHFELSNAQKGELMTDNCSLDPVIRKSDGDCFQENFRGVVEMTPEEIEIPR